MTAPEPAGVDAPCVPADDHLDELAEIISTAAHELRTPTTVIIGLAETLALHRDRLSREQVDDTVEALVRQGHRLIRLLDDLLDLSKIRSGRIDVELADVDLSWTLEAALAAATRPADREVIVDLGGTHTVVADHDRLEQVLVNLLTNAYRYGGPHIRVEAQPAPGGVVLVVCDDGDGVPSSLVPSLFEPFSPGTGGGKGGIGLGLSISRGLVESFGGRLWHERAQPHGARFNVFLRAGAGDAMPIPRLESTGPSAVERVTRVLVVDDEPDVLFLLRVTLQGAGYEVVEAAHGGDGWTRILQDRPDVLITDLMMPVMDGRELIRNVRDSAETAGIPIVLLSASPNDISGADRVIRKPFSPVHLTRTIQELIEGLS